MNEPKRTNLQRTTDWFFDNLAPIIIGSIGFLITTTLTTGGLYWGLSHRVAGIEHDLEPSQCCQRTRECGWHKDVEEAIGRMEQYMATGGVYRAQLERNREQIQRILERLYAAPPKP